MTSSLFDHAETRPEPSASLAFAENTLDRQSEERPDDCLARALERGDTQVLAVTRGRVVFKAGGEAPVVPFHAPCDVGMLSPDFANAVVMGYRADGRAVAAVPVGIGADALPEPYAAADCRSIYMQQMVPSHTLGLLAQGASLVAWTLSCLFCGRCGAPTEPRAGGYRRECASCGALHFPRTDPVVIMLAVDETRGVCLLGRSPHFRAGMYSCLAGFVEPGETIEDAVRRETLEESGITIGRVRYHASQPWPMPHTLMIGLYAEATSRTITHVTRELDDCRWFTPAETAAMLESVPGEERSSPPPGAIAHRLMRDWVAWRA